MPILLALQLDGLVGEDHRNGWSWGKFQLIGTIYSFFHPTFSREIQRCPEVSYIFSQRIHWVQAELLQLLSRFRRQIAHAPWRVNQIWLRQPTQNGSWCGFVSCWKLQHVMLYHGLWWFIRVSCGYSSQKITLILKPKVWRWSWTILEDPENDRTPSQQVSCEVQHVFEHATEDMDMD